MTPAPITAEYVAGIGWMYVTEAGRFGSFDTEQAAIAAGVAVRDGRAAMVFVQPFVQGPAELARLRALYPEHDMPTSGCTTAAIYRDDAGPVDEFGS